MCVGFVNAGIMKLEQTVGIIMGANIGTTVTAQLLRLGDIDADNIVMMFLQPSFLGPILAVVGIIFYMFIKGGHKRIVGQIVLGLGLLFIGMNTMSSAVEPLKNLPEFQSVFTAFSNPLLGVAVGRRSPPCSRAPPPLWAYSRPSAPPAWSPSTSPCR